MSRQDNLVSSDLSYMNDYKTGLKRLIIPACGIFIMILGFFLNYPIERQPFERFFLPKYTAVNNALQIIGSDKIVSTSTFGFNELLSMCSINSTPDQITGFVGGTTTQDFTKIPTESSRGIHTLFLNNTEKSINANCRSIDIQNNINKERDNKIHLASVIIFILGLIIAAIDVVWKAFKG